ncbi:BLUF domain-containing protein [Rubellimicrobium rubrum]|uniref:BLUF domain-containing protein n=1 Tax=Rubellimicrobium rubrum TaxID=2585369 RepID=A0A5C4MVL1_9RHOB|nr:BLUF domain-containing protein [Rubellimicrobium rubrum]TNC49625.1 BLUF domain-containing protein [Rubellimicrobium rubrum]
MGPRGPRDAMAATLEHIWQDERHGAVMLLGFDAVSSRGFANWSMALVGAEPDGTVCLGNIVAATQFDPSRLTSKDLYGVLSWRMLNGATVPT